MPNPTNKTDAMANKSLLKYISGVGTKIIQTSIMVAIIKILNSVPRPGFLFESVIVLGIFSNDLLSV